MEDVRGVLLTNRSNALSTAGVSFSNVFSLVFTCSFRFCGCFLGRERSVSSISKSSSSEEGQISSPSTEFSLSGLKSEEEGDELSDESSRASFLFLFVRFWGCFVGCVGVGDEDSTDCLSVVGKGTFVCCLGAGEAVFGARGCVLITVGGF